MKFSDELSLLIRARHPIIYIPSSEEQRVEEEIISVANSLNPKRRVRTWDIINGFQDGGEGRGEPLSCLEIIEKAPEKESFIFVLRDFHPFLKDVQICRKFRNLSKVLEGERKTIIIVSPSLEIPNELSEDILILDFGLPNFEEIEKAFDQMIPKDKCRLEPIMKETFIKACLGLTLTRVRQVLRKALASHGVIDETDIDMVLNIKKQIVRQKGILEFFPAIETIQDIGGLENIKDWLRKRASAFTEEARKYGLPPPKGILLTGIQGTGKSLCAKATAQLWRLPLLRLDVGSLFGQYVGESEAKTREAICLAEAMAPCVLWIDELDKGFGGIAGGFSTDSGTSQRVFSTFLTWLEEKKSPVFVVATANDIETLARNAPELLRKGRFDEIFFVDLPSFKERKEIFEIHIRKRRETRLREFDLDALAEASYGFSGAEIEQAIISAMYDAYDEEREFNTEDIIRNLKETVPLSRTARERIEALRQWAKSGRAKMASRDTDIKTREPVTKIEVD